MGPHRPSRLILALLSTLLLATAWMATPAQAGSKRDIEDLKELIQKAGTEIVYRDCKDKTKAGGYVYSKKENVDRLTICTDTVDLKDPDAVWEVLAHEATHIMQRCNDGTLLKDEYHPRVWRKLKAMAPHYVEILNAHYRNRDQMHEVEAFGMELQSPDLVKDWFVDFCLTKKKPADPKPLATPTCPPTSAGTPPLVTPKPPVGGSAPGSSAQRWVF